MTAMRDILTQAIPQLSAAGVDTPRLDAELLLAHVLGKTRAWLWAHPDEMLTEEAELSFHRLLERRLRREPLPYLLGEWEFYGRDFTVSADVLIPRPETELLVEAVLIWLRAHGAGRIADIGAGSGAIAVTLAAEMPALQVIAVDLSPQALAMTRRNALRHGVGEHITLLEGDLLQPIFTAHLSPLAAIVANLPYIAEEEYPALMPEVREYEPALALLAGEQGLALIRRLIADSPAVLAMRGLLAMEVGAGQAAAVKQMLLDNDWNNIQIITDYGGIPRHVIAESPV